MSRFFPTKNDLPQKTREQIIELANATLASAIDLSLQAKQAHWNVKGPGFIQLHELFDKVHQDAGEWVDLVAERAVQLGGVADGTLSSVAERTILPAYGLGIAGGREHADALSTSLAELGKTVRRAIDVADKAGDADSADLFTEISRGVDKMTWFVEAHLHADR